MFAILPVITEQTLLPLSLWTVTIKWILLPCQLHRALTKLSPLMCKILAKMSSAQERNRRGSGKKYSQVLHDLFSFHCDEENFCFFPNCVYAQLSL